MQPADVAAAAALLAVSMLRQACQAYWQHRRDRHVVTVDGRRELATVAIARNVLIVAAVALLLRGVPHGATVVLGWVLFLSGVAVRLVALAQLGAMYSFSTEVRREHRLVRRGLYAIVRHPLYAADMWSGVGIVVLCQSTALAIPLLVLVAAWLRRIPREDAALSAALGPAHAAYVREVPGLDVVRGAIRLLRQRRRDVGRRIAERHDRPRIAS